MLEVVELRAQRLGKSGEGGDELLGRQGDTDDSGGRGKDFFRLAAEDMCGGGAGGAGSGQTGFASGAIGVAGVDGGYADTAAGGAEMGLVDNERRGGDAVGGEGGGGACRLIGDDEGKVGAAALLEASFGGAKAEAAGDEELGGVRHVGHRS